MKKYKIYVLTLQNQQLTFTVSKYNIAEGDFIEFTDEKTGDKKQFHASRCEITEVTFNG